jgi:hypothetical protein
MRGGSGVDNTETFRCSPEGSTPSRQRLASQPEVSLAWAEASLFVKHRQRVLKLCSWPRNHVNAGAFVLSGCGGSIEGPLMARSVSIRPGSWSMAEVRDGLPGNLRSPVLSAQESRNGGRRRRNAPGLEGPPPVRQERASDSRIEGGKRGNWKRNHKRPVCSAGWRSVSVVSAKSGNLIEGTRRREGRRHRRELLTGNMGGDTEPYKPVHETATDSGTGEE